MSTRTSAADAVRRKVEGWRMAERRERALWREEKLEPEAALEAACELYEFAAIDPEAVDPVRAHEEEAVRLTWSLLRERFGWRKSIAQR